MKLYVDTVYKCLTLSSKIGWFIIFEPTSCDYINMSLASFTIFMLFYDLGNIIQNKYYYKNVDGMMLHFALS